LQGFSKKILLLVWYRIDIATREKTDSYLKLCKKPTFSHICGHLPSFASQTSDNNESVELNNLYTLSNFIPGYIFLEVMQYPIQNLEYSVSRIATISYYTLFIDLFYKFM